MDNRKKIEIALHSRRDITYRKGFLDACFMLAEITEHERRHLWEQAEDDFVSPLFPENRHGIITEG